MAAADIGAEEKSAASTNSTKPQTLSKKCAFGELFLRFDSALWAYVCACAAVDALVRIDFVRFSF